MLPTNTKRVPSKILGDPALVATLPLTQGTTVWFNHVEARTYWNDAVKAATTTGSDVYELGFAGSSISASRQLDDPRYTPAIAFTCTHKHPGMHLQNWYYIIEGVLYRRLTGGGRGSGLKRVHKKRLYHLVEKLSFFPDELRVEVDQFLKERFYANV